MNGGYVMIDATGLDLSESDPQEIAGSWDQTQKALALEKPMVFCGATYGDAPVSPVPGFGWQIAAGEIVLVGATLHIHVKSDDTCTVVDVVA